MTPIYLQAILNEQQFKAVKSVKRSLHIWSHQYRYKTSLALSVLRAAYGLGRLNSDMIWYALVLFLLLVTFSQLSHYF